MTSYLDPGTLSDVDSVLQPIRFLCQALGRVGQIRLLQEFTGGYTGTRVFLAEQQVSPGDTQRFRLVFKVGPSRLLREEVERYQVLIAHARAHKAFAPILEPKKTLETLLPGDSQGAIAYEHVAAAFGRKECMSLKDLVGQAVQGAAPLNEAEEVITASIQAIGSLYANPEDGFPFDVAKYYLDRWAPDFRVIIDEAVDIGGQWLLTRRRLNSARFWEESETYPSNLRQLAETPAATPQVDVVIRMLSPVFASGTDLFAHSPTSDVLSLAIDLRALSFEMREKVVMSRVISLWASAPAEESRFSFYRRRLQEAWSEIDLVPPILSFSQWRFHNPLYHLSRPLLEAALPLSKTRLVPAHGDLHPGNILVVGNVPVIIDYGLSEIRVPVGIDSARLLGGIIRDILSEILAFEDLATLVLALLALEQPPSDLSTPVGRAWRLLDRLQKETFQVSGPDVVALWPLHLLGYAFIGLKWPSNSPAQHRACGLLASAALTCVLGWPELEQEGKITPRPEIQPEGPSEILILMAKFAGIADYDPMARIYEALADHVFEVIPEVARVERIDEVASSRKEAIELAKRYQARSGLINT